MMSAALLGGMTSCMDDFDEPDLKEFSIFSQTSVGSVNTTIDQVKAKYCQTNRGATYSRNSSNWEFKIEDDQVFEGVVVANDGQWGAMYQQIILRSLDGAENPIVVEKSGQKDTICTNVGQCIQLGVKNTCLYPYFQIGQKMKINLKGLYVGVYSKTPKIGYPYFTSSGNHNLGPMPFEMCATNIELVGTPNASCAECQPVDLTGSTGDAWLRASANQKYYYSPLYAKIQGKFDVADGSAILAPDELEDQGYAVDRTLSLLSNNSNVTVRTSTSNELSHIVMPTGKVEITGILSYYSGWQIQFCELDDMKVIQ